MTPPQHEQMPLPLAAPRSRPLWLRLPPTAERTPAQIEWMRALFDRVTSWRPERARARREATQ